MPIILKAESLTKSFKSGDKSITVLDNIHFEVEAGKTMSIVGPSGSGKTTLLGLCAGLDQPSSGSVSLNGESLTGLSENNLAQLRNNHVGFVFQNFQLIPTLTALENVMVPLELRGEKNIKPRAEELLQRVGLGDRMSHYPSQLSGGEQQRVAIARAFSNRPKVLFADEPTGNLDDETSATIESLLFELNQEENTTLILVTHDHELANRTDQVLRLRAGKIQNQ
ncbi:MAG: putative ABC transport system ATP-binding protein [Cyclobacteriaceae bacterium]|jgi:putative ABC transport system ATP-binding protein